MEPRRRPCVHDGGRIRESIQERDLGAQQLQLPGVSHSLVEVRAVFHLLGVWKQCIDKRGALSWAILTGVFHDQDAMVWSEFIRVGAQPEAWSEF